MNETDLIVPFSGDTTMQNENHAFSMGLLCALVALVGLAINELRVRRRANADISQEIMARAYDERAMHEAYVACEGNAPAARSLYVRTRLRHQRKQYRPSLAQAAGSVLTAYMTGFMLSDLLLDAYTGDLFWWWDGGAASRETVIGLLWVVTLVLVPYITHSFAAHRRVSKARATGEVLGATFAAFMFLFLFSSPIAEMLAYNL